MAYETWRSVAGFLGYEVSDQGRVKSLSRRSLQGAMRCERILKTDVTSAGYHLVRLARGGVKYAQSVHRLVLTAFAGEQPEGCQARHLNGRTADNRLENLRWGTIEKNMADKKLHGTGIQGMRNPKARLTEVDVERVHDLRRFNLSQEKIGQHLGIDQTHVSKILRGKHWTQQLAA